VVGHVGDTRLYKLRAGRIEKLTRDHSPIGEREDAGELSEREAMQHPRRNEVYRDVGSEAHEPDDPHFIDVFRQRLEPDAALLLCSDGLTDAVPAATIAEVVSDYGGHPLEIVRSLIDAANAAGGKDNVTVIFAEGVRFAEGEDTRDLRTPKKRSVTPAGPHALETAALRVEREPVVEKKPKGRWRVAALVILLSGVTAIAAYMQRDRLPLGDFARLLPVSNDQTGGAAASAVVRVNPPQSIGEAIAAAPAGAEILVEPGEYREQLPLKTGVRVTSRVPRGATLRLPGGASETDAAVVAFEVSNAGFSGFRIQGDAATPLGTGIVIRNSTVSLTDLDISGANTAGIEYVGSEGGSVVGVDLHDNPGAAIIVRAGTSPRVAHNAFARNATSERAPGTLVVEAAARPSITSNTFHGLSPESIIVPPGMTRATLLRDNWFVNAPPERPATPPSRPSRGRR
jgi:PPM family protein phosphatase